MNMTEEISHRVDYKFELDGDQLKVSLADQNKVIECVLDEQWP